MRNKSEQDPTKALTLLLLDVLSATRKLLAKGPVHERIYEIRSSHTLIFRVSSHFDAAGTSGLLPEQRQRGNITQLTFQQLRGAHCYSG